MSRSGSLLRHNSALNRIIISLFLDFFVLIDDGSLSLVHRAHRLACKIGARLVVVERADSRCLIGPWTNVLVSLDLLGFLALGLRPRYSPAFDYAHIGIILSRAYFIFLFAFEVLDGRLIQLKLIVFVLVVTVGMDVGGNGRNRLVLVDVDQMLQNLRLRGGVGTHRLRSNLQASMVAA